MFFRNAVVQIPNFPAVISWHFSNRLWWPILLLTLEGGVLVAGAAMMRLERQLAQPTRLRRTTRHPGEK